MRETLYLSALINIKVFVLFNFLVLQKRYKQYIQNINNNMSDESSDVIVKQGDFNTTANNNTKRKRCLVTLVVVGIVITMIVIIVPLMSNGQMMSDLDLFRNEGNNNDLNDTHTWSNTGNGLELTIVNALDLNWHEYFNISVQQWDDGTPDSLTLSIEIADEPDTNCSPMAGYIKVCNGNYGPTEWEGINHAFLDSRGHIYASTAQMNEYFLFESSNTANRQYTMCHEIGHGFGLSHTDENMYNINQGNCMDYTTRPWNSQSPNDRNYNTLSIMYGVIGSDSSVTTNNATKTTSSQQQQQNRPSSVFDNDKEQQQQKYYDENDKVKTNYNKNENDRHRHRQQRRLLRHKNDNTKYIQQRINHDDNTDNSNIPDSVYRAWYELQNQFIYNTTKQIRRHLSSLSNSNRMISSIITHTNRNNDNNDFMETYTFHIDNGHSIRIQFLKSS